MIALQRRGIVDTYSQFSFARGSLAYDTKGRLYHPHRARFEPGKFGQAVRVEEGTTNLLLYSQDFTQSVWGKPQVDISSAGTYLNYPVTRFTPNNPGQWSSVDQLFLSSGAANRTFTWSFWARGQTNRQFSVNFYGGVSGTFAPYTINLTTEWQKFVITHTLPSNATLARIQWGNVNPFWGVEYTDWIEVAGVQVEEKPYGTSYMRTTSSTATRSPETLTIPTAGVLSSSEGTVECWLKLLRTPGTTEQFIFDGAGEVNQNLQIVVRTDGKLEVRYGTGSAMVNITGSTALVKDTWYRVACAWSSGGVSLSLDGTPEGSNETAPNLAFGANAYIGSRADSALQLDGLIDDLRVSALTLDFDGPDAQRVARVVVI